MDVVRTLTTESEEDATPSHSEVLAGSTQMTVCALCMHLVSSWDLNGRDQIFFSQCVCVSLCVLYKSMIIATCSSLALTLISAFGHTPFCLTRTQKQNLQEKVWMENGR